MPDRFAQDLPDVHIDFAAFADAIWHSFEDHLRELGQAMWGPFTEWLTNGIHASGEAIMNDSYVAISTLLWQLPAPLTYNLQAFRNVATDPVTVAVSGATLAIVLLGVRTILGAMVGRDHVLTYISGRIIPAVACAAGYLFILGWVVDHINQIAAAIGSTGLGNMIRFPGPPPNPFLLAGYVIIWLLLLWRAYKLLERVSYGLFRFLVAAALGPVAIILWAIPQTEWVTTFWIREFIGWGLTPVFTALALAMAIPLAAGQAGFLGAALFAMAGFKAAYDLVGLFAISKGGGGGGGLGITPFAIARLAAGAATGGAGLAAASIPPNRTTTLADSYGYQ